jgi:hypothetical protein
MYLVRRYRNRVPLRLSLWVYIIYVTCLSNNSTTQIVDDNKRNAFLLTSLCMKSSERCCSIVNLLHRTNNTRIYFVTVPSTGSTYSSSTKQTVVASNATLENVSRHTRHTTGGVER